MINEDVIEPELGEGEELLWAGHPTEFSRNPDHWIFVDIGFGGRKNNGSIGKTTGIKLPDEDSKNVTWSDCIADIKKYVNAASFPMNLMLEAPLSVAFDVSGNPAPRAFEKTDKGARYWYVPMGTNVAMSALFLLADLRRELKMKVRIYEAIVSFKSERTDHLDDANSMYKAVVNDGIMPLAEFKQSPNDKVESLTSKIGWNFGIPPVFIIESN